MIRIFDDLESLSQAAAEHFTVQSRQSISNCGRFSVALSGGEHPTAPIRDLGSLTLS